MKITVTLTDAELKGIKKYHRVCFDEKMTKKDVEYYIKNLVSGALANPNDRVSDFIREFENQQ